MRSFFSVLALSGCGSSDSTDGADGSDPVSPAAKPEALGFVAVRCLDAEHDAFTDLSSVARELGLDELAYVAGSTKADDNSSEKRDISVGVSSGSALDVCTNQACKDLALATADAAVTFTLTSPSEERTSDDPWSAEVQGLVGFQMLIGRRGETYTAVNTTTQLIDFIGPIDSPWKAHLLVFATDARYDVSCSAWVAPHQRRQTFVRAGAPNEILGIEPAPECEKQAEARRVLLGVGSAGESSIRSSATAWTGNTSCP